MNRIRSAYAAISFRVWLRSAVIDSSRSVLMKTCLQSVGTSTYGGWNSMKTRAPSSMLAMIDLILILSSSSSSLGFFGMKLNTL